MELKPFSRRNFLTKCTSVGAAFFGSAIILAACDANTTSEDNKDDPKGQSNPEKPCDDMSGVSAEELDKRHSLGYVTKSHLSDSYCSICSLYIPGSDEKCGKCLLFKGPVYAEGYCVQFAPKSAG